MKRHVTGGVFIALVVSLGQLSGGSVSAAPGRSPGGAGTGAEGSPPSRTLGAASVNDEWKQSSSDGFGTAANDGVIALSPYGGSLYAGTDNSAGAQLWKLSSGTWSSVMTDGFGDVKNTAIDHLFAFGGNLYAGTANEVEGAQVLRSSDGSIWNAVAPGGFGDMTNAEVQRFASFGGQIYAGTWNYSGSKGGEIWRSSTGNSSSWSRVVQNGFGDAHNDAVISFEVLGGYLYAGTDNYDVAHSTSTGGEVWRSSTGNAGSWSQVNTDGYGDASSQTVSALAAFGGRLYAAVNHLAGAGASVWRCGTCDGTDWTLVVSNGFANTDNRGMSSLEVLGDQLYYVVGNNVAGLQVWRTRTGNAGDWRQVATGGFGDAHNFAPYWDNSTAVSNGTLFVGTCNTASGGEVWMLLHRVFLPTVLRNP